MNLTENFTLAEMLASQSATREGIAEQFNPPAKVFTNLQLLCINILQPLRNNVGHTLHISSGYRCEKVNKLVGGAATSQHVLGMAADVEDYAMGNKWLFKKIIDLALPFDQLIYEFGDDANPAWVHVSFNNVGGRKEILRISKSGTIKLTAEKALAI